MIINTAIRQRNKEEWRRTSHQLVDGISATKRFGCHLLFPEKGQRSYGLLYFKLIDCGALDLWREFVVSR